jgi:hypothetical protein
MQDVSGKDQIANQLVLKPRTQVFGEMPQVYAIADVLPGATAGALLPYRRLEVALPAARRRDWPSPARSPFWARSRPRKFAGVRAR